MSNIDMSEKSNLIQRLDRILDWIKSCDTKASIVIAGIGVTLTLLTSSDSLDGMKKIIISFIDNINFANLVYLMALIVSLGLTIWGLINLILVLVPRLNKFSGSISNTRASSLYYFGKISNIDYASFKQNMEKEINTPDEIEDLLSQIYINAQICNLKYSYYRKGIMFSFIGIGSFISLYIIGLFLLSIGGF